MTDTEKTDEGKEQEISVSAEGVTIKGPIVEDIRKPIRRVAGTADSVLRLFHNIVSIPIDYLSTNLEGFRRRYAEKFEEIPVDSRIEPSLRIGVAVLQQASLTADEPDIQELFAQLLASASNTQTADNVHPAFATIISELHAIDAQVLRFIAANTRGSQEPVRHLTHNGIDANVSARSVSNLIRLGLLEWKDAPYTPAEINRFAGKRMYSIPSRPSNSQSLFVEAVNDLQRLKNQIMSQLSTQHKKRALYISSFGELFIAVVLK